MEAFPRTPRFDICHHLGLGSWLLKPEVWRLAPPLFRQRFLEMLRRAERRIGADERGVPELTFLGQLLQGPGC